MNHYVNAMKNYAVFQGRARRAEYWTFVAMNLLVPAVAVGLTALTGRGLFVMLAGVHALVAFVPSLAVTVRRLHDTGRAGTTLFLSLAPIVGPLAMLYLLTKRGDETPNQFGPSPRTLA